MMSDNELLQQLAARTQQTLQQAIAYQQAGQLQDAERLYRAILQDQPRHPDANHNLGLIAVQVKQTAAGLPYLKTALEANPARWQFWLSYTDALVAAGQARAALDVMELGRKRGLDTPAARAQRQKIEIAVQNCNALGNPQVLAEIEQLFAPFNAGRYLEVENRVSGMLQQHPNLGVAWKLLGASLMMQGKESVSALQKAASLLPEDAEAHFNLGLTRQGLGQIGEAVAGFRRAVEIKPDFAEAHDNLGLALKDIGLCDDAVACHRRALEIKPDFAEAHNNLGMALKNLGHFDEAVASYRRAVEIKPDFVKAHNNLGNALLSLRRFGDAAACFRRALEIKPDYANAHSNLGITLQDIGQLDDAIASFRRAVAIKPDFAAARYNLGCALLSSGSLTEGWQEFEYRWKTGVMGARPFAKPQWLGDAELHGKAILLHAEQGFGDTLQFLRYAPLVAKLGAKVYLEVPLPLKSLATSCAGVAAVFAVGDALPSFDFHCPLMSLPLAFHTELATIPSEVPYLAASTIKSAQWRERLGQKSTLRVGLTWAGNPRKHLAAGDGVRMGDLQRSIHFDQLCSLLEVPGIEFFSLQLGDDAVRQLNGNPQVIDVTADLHDFEDTAALIDNLDLVICVDTSVAHLAGAIGKPVWLLNRYNTCWRWLMEREDSPWYPTVRIFRQPSFGDWNSVISNIKQALANIRCA